MSSWILLFLPFLLAAQYMLLLFLAKKNWKDHSKESEGLLPSVSILIAVRNEEKDLPRLLKSLERLDYPSEKLQILIADDQSEDRTPELLSTWAAHSKNRKIITVLPSQTGLFHPNGKANALSILARETQGDFFFFTDADCEVSSTWIREGVSCFGHGVGLVIGITQVRSGNLFEGMQEMDWWNTLGIVKVVTDLGLSTTGLGNNMAISKEAYFECGGFESIPFSLTEDLEISRAVRKSGFRQVHQVSPRMLITTKAEATWRDLLRQRKRWMHGVMSLSIGWKFLLGFQFLFYPLIVVLLFLIPSVGLGLWGVKVFFQSLFLHKIASYTNQKLRAYTLVIFDFYQILALSLTILYYFWPVQTEWKTRKYP
ncbi:MAG: glycosyltransferase [Algoriphagus sp.]|jgi:cellulose synthase/poly-beta-1,6-N-acetylglucosamine synthase-like glycosyltransferase|nr:glycosyltransferase [Algoriphagus sp.]